MERTLFPKIEFTQAEIDAALFEYMCKAAGARTIDTSVLHLDAMIASGYRGNSLPRIRVDFTGTTVRVSPRGRWHSVITMETRIHEREHSNTAGPLHGKRSWWQIVRNRIAYVHDARATDGIDDGLIRAERWNAVY